MYIHIVTRAKKAIIKKMTQTMSLDEIKQAKKNHSKNRKIIHQQKNKYKNKNKLNLNEMM